ncbi:radical SAM protein [Mangrovibacterium diazotrophicum]|uniref:Radical SAM core domain-containing protein n=1 Tax=Mangrovibacterium diazotrophicum TaxID=1261403 RepID=A0A419W4S3_9BACT|nr:radical SAM protein [Mangrovibacterium diazotrophicum]RKD90442.1 hypothetical protein BC643_0782 [Mangrovibacterium diazotrophicum]
MKKNRDYTFHEATTSLCSDCMQRIPAKIVLKDGHVFLKKSCPQHGIHFELLEEDADYHLAKRRYDKPGTFTTAQTSIRKGCPYDCGLCPDHDQHTCIGLIEVTNQCNLNCPVCFANSGKEEFLTLEQIDQILDKYIALENGDAEILQISGGEPTVHPQILEIIQLALSKKIRFVMLNTNGVRIASDKEFARQLSQFKERFEVYLQFDGFKESTHRHFRGKDLRAVKQKAIDNLLEEGVPVTLVSTVENGINDDELGPIVEFGMNRKGIRGVSFQPVSYFGRIDSTANIKRSTLSGIIKQLESQLSSVFKPGDIIPLPCNVERVAISYLIKDKKGRFTPLPRTIKVDSYLPVIENTFAFDAERFVNEQVRHIQNNLQLCDCFKLVNDIYKYIPRNYKLKSAEDQKNFIDENTFRISITSFLDKHNFDLKSAQKECVHILTPDLKRMPFSTYNLLYRK